MSGAAGRRRLVLPAGAVVPGLVVLDEATAHYAKDVLRLRVGAQVTLLDGAGLRAGAEVRTIGRQQVELWVQDPERMPTPGPPRISLYQALGKGEKMDQVVRQATELGVAELVPVLTARSVPRGEGRLERWRAIAEDAVRVSGRAFRPHLGELTPLSELLAQPRRERALVLALEQDRDLPTVLGPPQPLPGAIEVLIGPEGGLEPEELTAAIGAGFTPAHLGSETLRTETAGPAIVAMLRFWARNFT